MLLTEEKFIPLTDNNMLSSVPTSILILGIICIILLALFAISLYISGIISIIESTKILTRSDRIKERIRGIISLLKGITATIVFIIFCLLF